MNKKLLMIQVLKQRISNMQQDLNRLEKDTTKPKRQVSKSLSQPKERSSSPIRKTIKDKRYKSPTFWTGNPILGEQNKYTAQMYPSPPKRPQRNQLFVVKSPIQQKIMRQVNLSYYQSAPQEKTPDKQNISKYDSLKGNFSKTNQSKLLELFARNFPKVQKVKTYELPKKDPILNPEPPKVSSKKITTPLPRSPKNMYLDNPNSNPNLYFNSTQPINLSPKVNNNRNRSAGVNLLLSNSLQNLGSYKKTPPKQSGKKHYTKYFKDNYESKWMMQW